jgi:hypothetical protein
MDQSIVKLLETLKFSNFEFSTKWDGKSIYTKTHLSQTKVLENYASLIVA